MFALSALGHLVFFILITIMPTSLPSSYRLAPQAIGVDLVSLPPGEPAAAPPATEAAPEPEPQAAPEPPPPEPEAVSIPASEPESVAPAPKPEPTKVVKSLKKKTLKKDAAQKTVVQKPTPVKKPATPAPPPERKVSKAIESMREKVAQQEKKRAVAGTGSGRGTGTGGGGGGGGTAVLTRIQNYKFEAAFAVGQNWAFSQQLAGVDQGLETRITFRILPNGEITDIQIVQPSGNRYLDESAFRAVRKASPVAPHPEGINRPYIEVGVKATPTGFR